MSLEKSTVCVQARAMRPMFKKVQVVYYLSRNGQLEHPHTVEVTHLAHQQLRLKDVLDRLAVLRGKGMPTLYSWSCKRSYKNGYVWNDLGENDIIYPSERAEYVLKASELIDASSDKSFNSLHNGDAQVTKNHRKDTYLVSEPRIITSQALKNKHCHHNSRVKALGDHQRDAEEEEECGTKSSSITPHRCSKGVSTDELQEEKTLLPSDMSNASTTSFSISTPSTTSSTLSDKTHDSTTQNKVRDNCNNNNTDTDSSNTCKKHENGDAAEFNEPMLSRNSMLLSLIACGAGSVSFRKSTNNNVITSSTEGRKSGNLLHSKEVSIDQASTCKKALMKSVDDEMITIGSMSENPRFGNLQAEEKEYFSGSIVESVVNYKRSHHDNAEPRLKKSSSCNEERSEVSGLREAAEQEEEITKKEKGVKESRKKIFFLESACTRGERDSSTGIESLNLSNFDRSLAPETMMIQDIRFQEMVSLNTGNILVIEKTTSFIEMASNQKPSTQQTLPYMIHCSRESWATSNYRRPVRKVLRDKPCALPFANSLRKRSLNTSSC